MIHIGNRNADGNDKRLVNLGPNPSFSSNKLTTSSGKNPESMILAHILSLTLKILTSAKDTDHLYVGFDRDRVRRQRELTNNKKQRGRYQVKFMLRDVFGFPEHRKKDTYGLG